MPNDDAQNDQEGMRRRRFLGSVTASIGSVMALPLLLGLKSRLWVSNPRRMDLPGDGSIFQPRNDFRLEEWKRRNKN